MKKILLCALFALVAFSCDKDKCLQEAECTKITNGTTGKTSHEKTSNTVEVCHNGKTLSINESALQSHLDHGDTEGSCTTLSDGGLVFMDGELVEIGCKYDLPFIHVDEDGASWLFE